MLDKELEGVKAPDIETPTDVTDTDDAAIAADGGADETPAPEGDKPEGGRTLENVRRELLRKQEKERAEILAQLAQIANTVANIATKPAQKPAQTFDDMTLAEVQALRANVPDERKAEFDAYVADRQIADRIDKKLNQHKEAERYKAERDKSKQLAVNRFPQLLDKSSALYAEVNRRLVALDANYIQYNPRIVLNVTEDVASELGINPRLTRGTRSVDLPSSTRRSEKPTATSESGVMSDAEYETLAARYKGTKKGGFDKARILKRSKEYADFNRGND